MPQPGLRQADDTHGRGRQRAPGHCFGRVLRASARVRQVSLPLLPVPGAGGGRVAGHRRRHPGCGPTGPPGDQPLRRPLALLPLAGGQRPIGRANAALDTGAVIGTHRRGARSRCGRRTGASCSPAGCCTPTRRPWRCSIAAGARPAGLTPGVRLMLSRVCSTSSARVAVRSTPSRSCRAMTKDLIATQPGAARWCATVTRPKTASSRRGPHALPRDA